MNNFKRKINNKKGASATTVLIFLLVIALIVVIMIARLNWQRFKVEAKFGFYVTIILITAMIIIVFVIRHNIKKRKKEKERQAKIEEEKRQAEAEGREYIESSLGNGKFEAADITEAAKKAGDKVVGAFKSDDEGSDEGPEE